MRVLLCPRAVVGVGRPVVAAQPALGPHEDVGRLLVVSEYLRERVDFKRVSRPVGGRWRSSALVLCSACV